jgi:hypothetical protein
MQDQLFQMNAHGDTWQEPQLGDAPMIGDPTPAGAPADALERIAEARAWIIPMANVMTDVVGWASEHVVAGEPLWFQGWCECKHRDSAHDAEYGCRGAYGDECDCRELRPVPNVPEMHRIRRWSYGDTEHESLTLTSYSSASLWEGRKLYASHYA